MNYRISNGWLYTSIKCLDPELEIIDDDKATIYLPFGVRLDDVIAHKSDGDSIKSDTVLYTSTGDYVVCIPYDKFFEDIVPLIEKV